MNILLSKCVNKNIYISRSKLISNNDERNRGLFTKKKIKKNKNILICPIIPINIKDYTVLENSKHELGNYVFCWDEKDTCFVLGFGSLFNHSDNPNIEWYEDKEKKLMYFYTSKKIKKDEELLINYGESWFTS